MLVLDTTILIELEAKNEKVAAFLKKYVSQYPSRPYITTATYSEFYYGFLKKTKNVEKAHEFLEPYEILHTSRNSSQLLAHIKYNLETRGKMIPVFDILIASIVLDRKATLCTTDVHFKNISELPVLLFENS